MRAQDADAEKAIVLAFLRTGHPLLALATVIIKSVLRATGRLAILAACLTLSPGGGPIAALPAPPVIHGQ
jgi:hypothetical protein